MLTRSAAGIMGFALLFAAAVSAADVQLPAAGSRVRVRAQGVAPQPLIATLVAIEADRIAVKRWGSSEIVTIPKAAVERFEVSRGEGQRSRNAAIGALAGLVLGAALGAALGQDCGGPSAHFVCFSRTTTAFATGTVGAGAGAVIGLASGGETWEAVNARCLRSRQGPGAGVALAFSISF